MSSPAQRILYIGATSGTSRQRARALERLGHEVLHISPYEALPRYWGPWLDRAGGAGIDRLVARSLLRQIGNATFDLALVDSGDVIGPAALQVLRAAAPVVGNYNQDNPYRQPSVEGRRWEIFRRTCRGYDLLVTPRRPTTESDVRGLTGKAPLQVWVSADEVAHRPPAPTAERPGRWASEVAFAGTWMPGRGAFLLRLIELGVAVAIYGHRWRKAPEYRQLAAYIRSGHLQEPDYREAISGAKIALVLLNAVNGDLHTNRSTEIPAIGTAMCAPRTAFHLQLYGEGSEAVFFDDVEECAAQCRRLLADPALRQGIAAAGHARTLANATYNEPLMRGIVDRLQRVRHEQLGKAA